MANTPRQHSDQEWTNAQKVCRLNRRQVEMARALGMNPKKLPALRPTPQQRWKLPVGEFIEDLYTKRFGANAWHKEPHRPKPPSRTSSSPQGNEHAPQAVTDSSWQAQNLICYLRNLADDLEEWLGRGPVAQKALRQIGDELHEIADALDTGGTIPQVPGIAKPPRERNSRSLWRNTQERTFDDDVPF
jgi:hypothetical protein